MTMKPVFTIVTACVLTALIWRGVVLREEVRTAHDLRRLSGEASATAARLADLRKHATLLEPASAAKPAEDALRLLKSLLKRIEISESAVRSVTQVSMPDARQRSAQAVLEPLSLPEIGRVLAGLQAARSPWSVARISIDDITKPADPGPRYRATIGLQAFAAPTRPGTPLSKP